MSEHHISPTPLDINYVLKVALPMAQLAYEPSAVAKWPLPPGYAMVGLIQPGNMGFVAYNRELNSFIIGERGTETADEWLEDFEAVPFPWMGTLVHRGFLRAHNEVRGCIFSLINSVLPKPGYTVYLYGHSLGAALAELMAFELSSFPNIIVKICTFAGPRVGLHGFVSTYDARIHDSIRVVNTWDIVPHAPPAPLYEHNGYELAVDGGFTHDLHVAHSLPKAYEPGLTKLWTPVGVAA